MKPLLYFSFLLFFLSGVSIPYSSNHSSSITYPAGYKLIKYQGRTELRNDSIAALISSASSATMSFKGESCELLLKSEPDHHNYINLELDGKYLGKFKIEHITTPIKVQVETTSESHILKVFKATEAASGSILFEGIKAEELVTLKETQKKTIEFIGNSITCGALSDSSEMPCEEGAYLDHHNAYLAYGPQVARALDVNFILSAVSGIGIYRNWNDEHIDEPIMPQVYENLYLNTDSTKPFPFLKQPDIVSICLGTNDMSGGDGQKARLPFDPEKFTKNYIDFVKTIYSHYPTTKIVLLNSPMLSSEQNDTLLSCLKKVQNHFKDRDISLFQFEESYFNGCSYHPSTEEQKLMATKLTPFFEELLNN